MEKIWIKVLIGLLVAGIGTVSADTFHVPDDYSTIQMAVDAANQGDTIIVRDGTYGKVSIDKQLTVRSENGSDHCVVDAGSLGSAIVLRADGITLKGFTTINSGSWWNNAGISVASNGNNIINNCASHNNCGIYLKPSTTNNVISNTVFSNNDRGIYIYESSGNNITSNDITSNDCYGIYIYESSTNLITSNNISNNDDGIFLSYSSKNMIYLNDFMDNSNNVYSSSSTNIWNSTSLIAYTYNGSDYENYLGNYWNDYTGSDSDGNGIGDTPNSLSGAKDNKPLMQSWEDYFAPKPAQYLEQIMKVHLDIKPGSCSNPINVKSKGILPAAVLGTEGLDVTTINVSTVRLTVEGAEGSVIPVRWSYEDISTPDEGDADCGSNGYSGDGYMDLTLKFDTQEVVNTLGLDELADNVTLILTGDLQEDAGSTSIEGKDFVWILQQSKPNKPATTEDRGKGR